MKILSLFDGMGCGAIAFTKLGVPIDRYVAYEYDEETANAKKGRPFGYAALVASHNFPYIEQRGDVFKADFTEFKGFDAVIGGSPCTYWSIAQKNNRETEASGLGWELFSQYVRAVKEAKPKYFLYENNKSMSKEIRASITEMFGFEPILINSALVSAQNRQRLYWVGIRQSDGTYSKADIEQPEDKGILLRDILDNAVAWQEKAYALTTRCSGAIPEDTLTRHRHTMCAEPVNTTADGKARTIRATCYKDGIRNMVGNNIDQKTCVAEPVRVGEVGNGGQGNRIYSVDAKSVSQTSSSGGIGSNTGLYAVPSDGKTQPTYEVLNGLITINDKQYPIKLADGYYIIRKLSVSECKRLQTVPEWYDFSVISNSQAYKCLGNGWTVDVITHLIQCAMAEQWAGQCKRS